MRGMSEAPPPEHPRPLISLSERQQSAIAAALTILSAIVIVCTALGTGWVLSKFFGRFSHVFLPLAVAGIMALVFHPYYEWLETKVRLPTSLALAAVALSVLIPIGAFAWFFGALAVEQISDLVTRFPALWRDAVADAKNRWPEVREFLETNPWGKRLWEAIQQKQNAVLNSLPGVGNTALDILESLGRLAGLLTAWAVFPIYFAFFLITDFKPHRKIRKALPFLKPSTREDVIYLVTEFVNIIVAFFRGQLIVAFLQGMLFAIGFSLVGLRYGFVLGLLLGFLNIIPYLGSILGLGIGLPLALLQPEGGWTLVAAVLVVFTIVQSIEGYLLTPRIMGDRTGLHPMVIIVAIFFWGSALNGILGMILAIPLTAFLVVFWRLAREKYIAEIM